jgi:radical SAM protein with 4Fe4S-binding SPASM domain
MQYVEMIARERRRGQWWPRRRTRVAANRALQFQGTDEFVYHCTAGETLLTVMANGDVVPCRRMPIPVGNVYTGALLDLYRESPLLLRLREPEQVAEGCQGCDHHTSCRGGLRCLSYATYGDPWQADPGCAKAEPVFRHKSNDSRTRSSGFVPLTISAHNSECTAESTGSV